MVTKIIVFLFLASNTFFSQTNVLKSKLDSIKSSYNVVGMSVVATKGDSIIFNEGYGKKDISRNLEVNESTVYRIASISKTVTATALMILYDKELFRLNDDISEHIGFTLRNPYFPQDTITVGKVLSHTAGLRDGSGYFTFLNNSYNSGNPPTISELLLTDGKFYTDNMFSRSKSPSSNYFQYANINYGVIGTLVERLSGKRFDQFCKENIFDKLQLNVSFNVGDFEDINDIATLYRYQNGAWKPQADNYNGNKPDKRDLSNYDTGTNGIIFAPQGGLRASAGDLAKLLLMYKNGGSYKSLTILSDQTTRLMFETAWSFNGSNGDNYYGIFKNYGFGCHQTTDLLPGKTLLGHPGEAYGLISDMYFSLEENYGIIFLTNGGRWSEGNYSGWYDIEEDVFRQCYKFLSGEITDVSFEKGNDKSYHLFQNYPNPFNPSTIIDYVLPDESYVEISIFDILGKEVRELVARKHGAGKFSVEWDGSDDNLGLSAASGLYLCRMSAGLFRKTIKLQYIK